MDMNKHRCLTMFSALGHELLREIQESDSSSESDNDSDTFAAVVAIRTYRRKPQRVTNYLEFTLEKLTSKQFQEHFRITIDNYEILLKMLAPSLKKRKTIGRDTINPERQILSVLWLLATPDSYRSVGERFNMNKSSLPICFMRIVKRLCQMAPLVIKWPSQNEKNDIKQHFETMGNLPHIVGAIDGTYINIKAPKEDPEVYVTRKCTYAFTLQAVCDASLKFTDVYVGYPGSVSDNRIFRNSYIYRDVENDRRRFFSNEEYIIGDKAYPVSPWCIPPYINRGNNLTPARIYFNHQHAKTRQTIERCFALYFGRFRRAKYLDMNRTDMIPSTVLAMCVLHNICINTELDERFVEEGIQHLANIRIPDMDNEIAIGVDNGPYGQENNDGYAKREDLCTELFLHRNNY